MPLPLYPDFIPITLELQNELTSRLMAVTSGISEFTFPGLYLFRATYGYRVASLPDGGVVLSGSKAGQPFFSLPLGLPAAETMQELLGTQGYGKNLSKDQVTSLTETAATFNWEIIPDRNNWDYIYDCREMSELAGKKFHKKRNLIHQFHQHHTYSAEPLTTDNLREALGVLELWAGLHPEGNDTTAAREALELRDKLGLSGKLYRIEGKPVGYTLGEEIARTGTYVIHFEKADPSYKGIYQVIFQDYACSLVERYPVINREQDLGDEGLRQAKETYRPIGFVEKFQLRLP